MPGLRSLIALLSVAALTVVRAQTSPDVLTTVGTSTAAGPGSDSQVYLLWTSETAALLGGQRSAVFRKPGDFDSPSPYSFVAFVEAQSSQAVARVLIDRASALGQDPLALEETVDAIFAGVADVSAFNAGAPDDLDRVARKMVYLLEAARGDGELRRNLVFASRDHPAISLVLGQAFTEALPSGGRVSYELRACPPGSFDPGDATRVTGRVTLVPGQPAPLPAPDAPFEVVPEDRQEGHLNARLRWGTPDALRQRVVLHYGYDVLRVPTILAGLLNWDDVPPDWNAELAANNAAVTRVNRYPVLPDLILTDAQADPENAAAAPGDVYFITDDNRRFEDGGTPLVDGRSYTYFVAARDILGRLGLSSPGTGVVVRDRLAPPAPRRLQAVAVHDPITGEQVVRITFEPNVSPAPNGDVTRRYHLYRWADIDEIDIRAAAAPIATQDHLDGLRTFIDGDPSTPGEIVWYTVRAEDAADADGLGNGNLSNHSRPASAAIRDRSAPGAPPAVVSINCLRPSVVSLAQPPPGLPSIPPPGDPELTSLSLVCAKKNVGDQFDWVEFWGANSATPEPFLLTRAYFASPDAPFVVANIESTIPKKSGEPLAVACRVSARGKVSPFSTLIAVNFTGGEREPAHFEAEIQVVRAPAGPACPDHVNDGAPPEVTFDLPPDAVAWNIRMRVDDGAYQLVAQGVRDGANNAVSVSLDAIPAFARSLCFYLQVFDSSGNASPLTEIVCLGVRAPGLPAPLLAAPEGIGTPGSPMAQLSWFCPPATVDRFRVFVGVQGDESTVPDDLSGQLGGAGPPIQPGPAPQHPENFRTFDTGRIAGSFPPVDDATFEAALDVVPGLTYIYYVQALGPNGEQGPVSNSQTFRWSPPDALYAACSAPLTWPAESVEQNFNAWLADLALRPIDSRIALTQSNDPQVRGGVLLHIGRFNWTGYYKGNPQIPPAGIRQDVTPLNGTKGTSAYVFPGPRIDFTDSLFEEDLLPLVLYRAMVPGGPYVVAGGESYQVSPMMESITQEAINIVIDNDTLFETRVFDPYIFMEPGTDDVGNEIVDIYLRDTQPVIRGTTYHYILVNFDPRSKEIAKVRSLGFQEIN